MHPERPRPIRDTAAELAIMAQGHGLEALVFTLGMVHLEASSRLAEIGGVPALGMPQWDGADIHTKETATLAS